MIYKARPIFSGHLYEIRKSFLCFIVCEIIVLYYQDPSSPDNPRRASLRTQALTNHKESQVNITTSLALAQSSNHDTPLASLWLIQPITTRQWPPFGSISQSRHATGLVLVQSANHDTPLASLWFNQPITTRHWPRQPFLVPLTNQRFADRVVSQSAARTTDAGQSSVDKFARQINGAFFSTNQFA